MEELGLRERKKHRTREAILEAAYALFRESGFDAVSVADVAAAAEVSKPTLFAYFPTKEDLVLRRFLEPGRGPAQVIRGRSPALAALRQDFLDRLAERDPRTGLNDSPAAMTFHELLYSTPPVMARLATYLLEHERDLAAELLGSGEVEPRDEFTARLVAAQVMGAQRILSYHTAGEVRAGRGVDEIYPDAVRRTNTAFDLLERGLSA